MAKYYIESGNVSFVVCANDAEGAALWAMHRTIDNKVCQYEGEAEVRAQLVEDAMLFEASDGGFGHDEEGCIDTEEVFLQWRQLMTAMDRLFDQMG